MDRAAVLALVFAACGDNLPDDPAVVCGGGEAPCVDVHIVAHQDDDLLFMNPDLAAGIAAGNRVATVYITAGTRGDPAYMGRRELGILNAYSYMIDPAYAVREPAEVPQMLAHWHPAWQFPLGDTGRLAIRYDFAEPIASGATVSLVFLRTFEVGDPPDLRTLWSGETPTTSTVACIDGCPLDSVLDAQTFDREQLLDALDAAITDAADPALPLVISTLDATQLFHREEAYGLGWVDNSDHIAAAEFGVAAFIRHHRRPSARGSTLVQYRGYNTGREDENIPSDGEAKACTFYRYYAIGEQIVGDDGTEWTNHDAVHPRFRLKTYAAWTKRRYGVYSLPESTGTLATADGQCLTSTGPGPCAGAPRWTLTERHELRSPDGACLVADADGRVTARTCLAEADADRQTWILTDTGQLRGRDATCLDASLRAVACAKQVDAEGAPMRQAVASQQWHWAD